MSGGALGALGGILPVPVLADGLRRALAGSPVPAGAVAAPLVWALVAFIGSLLVQRARLRIRPERLAVR